MPSPLSPTSAPPIDVRWRPHCSSTSVTSSSSRRGGRARLRGGDRHCDAARRRRRLANHGWQAAAMATRWATATGTRWPSWPASAESSGCFGPSGRWCRRDVRRRCRRPDGRRPRSRAPVGILTNHAYMILGPEWFASRPEFAGLATFIDAAEIGCPKPDPQAYLLGGEALGVAPATSSSSTTPRVCRRVDAGGDDWDRRRPP